MTKENKSEKELKDLIIDDTSYKTEFTKKYENQKPWTAPDNRKITGFLPGTVTKILVKKGDKVKAGDTVLKFEAMKMVNSVQTAVDGVVKGVYAQEGDRFPKGFILVEIE